jgi:hypothetical protein
MKDAFSCVLTILMILLISVIPSKAFYYYSVLVLGVKFNI